MARVVLAAAVVLVSILSSQASAVTFADGAVHVIDASNSFPFEGVAVQDPVVCPGFSCPTTTLNVVDGGQIGTALPVLGVDAYGKSQVSVSGGTIGNVAAAGPGSLVMHDNSSLSFTGGIANNQILLLDSSSATVSGGSAWGINLFLGTSTAVVSGGVLFRNSAAQGMGTLTVTGGEFQGAFDVAEDGTAIVSGGTFREVVETTQNGDLQISGGVFEGDLFALHTSAVTIAGSGFNFPFGSIAALSGMLTGTLLDGSPLSVNFGRASTATITLVPEPDTATLLELALVGLAVRRRRRAQGSGDGLAGRRGAGAVREGPTA